MDRLATALSACEIRAVWYLVERELGRGGMAAVYQARDLKHDRPVALKVLLPELAATLGSERFQRAIRFAARLQHPQILTERAEVSSSGKERPMQFEALSFGSLQIDGITYEHDVVIDRGEVRKRKKRPSQKFRDAFGHTPVSLDEDIPWKCRRLVIGTGTGALPVMEEVKLEAERRKIALVIVPTVRAIALLTQESADTNAILHVTC